MLVCTRRCTKVGTAVNCYFKDGAIKDEKVVTHKPKPPHTDSGLSLKLSPEPPSACRVDGRKLLPAAPPPPRYVHDFGKL